MAVCEATTPGLDGEVAFPDGNEPDGSVLATPGTDVGVAAAVAAVGAADDAAVGASAADVTLRGAAVCEEGCARVSALGTADDEG